MVARILPAADLVSQSPQAGGALARRPRPREWRPARSPTRARDEQVNADQPEFERLDSPWHGRRELQPLAA